MEMEKISSPHKTKAIVGIQNLLKQFLVSTNEKFLSW